MDRKNAPRYIDDEMIQFATGQMHDEERVQALFQKLVDTGRAWKMTPDVAKFASKMIEQGKVRAAA